MTAATTGPRWRRLLPDLLAVAVLLLVTVKINHSISMVRDLRFDDEPTYLSAGIHLAGTGFPGPQYNPLYAAWYFALSKLIPDPIALYFANVAILSGLLAVLLYALTRAAGAPRSIALLAGGLLLASRLPEVSPLVMHLATAVIAAGTALAVWSPTWRQRVVVLAATFLVAAYIRPEFGAAFLLFAVLAGGGICVGLARRRVSWRRAVGPVVAVSCLVIVFFALGNTLAGGRSIFAFTQHYALNRVESEKLQISPWYNGKRVFAEDFGDAASVGEAALRNPGAMLWHVGRNLQSLPRSLTYVLSPQLDFPRSLHAVLGAVLGAIGVLGGLGLYRRLRAEVADPAGSRMLVAIGAAALACVPPVAAMGVIYPRLHYILPVAFFVLAGALSSLHWLPRTQWLLGWRALVAVAALLIIVAPNRANGWNPQQLMGWREDRPVMTPNQDTARFLRRLPVEGQVTVLDADRAFPMFAGMRAPDVVSMLGLDQDLATLIDQNDIDLVALSSDLLGLFPGATGIEEAMEDMRRRGFVIYRIGANPVWLAVRRDRLGPAGAGQPPTPAE